MKKITLLFTIITFLLFFYACEKKLPLAKDLTKKSYNLINQDGEAVYFPAILNNKITVMGFIFTHCPDICPMTTHNMYLTEKQLKKDGIKDVKFIALSFDPERDTPKALKKFAEARELDMQNWNLLTGEMSVIKDLLRRFDVRAVKTDESLDESGHPEYSMMHTDRISLIDNNGMLRKNYKGSTLNIKELVNDIKLLEE